MAAPSRVEREALLDLLLALGGPLVWTGPVPYDALAAMMEGAAWLLFCVSGVEIVRWRETWLSMGDPG